MNLSPLRVDKRGRITIPQELREKYGIKENDTIYIDEKDGCIVIYPSSKVKIQIISHKG